MWLFLIGLFGVISSSFSSVGNLVHFSSLLSAGNSKIYTKTQFVSSRVRKTTAPRTLALGIPSRNPVLNISKVEPIILYYHQTLSLQKTHVLLLALPLTISQNGTIIVYCSSQKSGFIRNLPAPQPIIPRSFCIYHPLLYNTSPQNSGSKQLSLGSSAGLSQAHSCSCMPLAGVWAQLTQLGPSTVFHHHSMAGGLGFKKGEEKLWVPLKPWLRTPQCTSVTFF